MKKIYYCFILLSLTMVNSTISHAQESKTKKTPSYNKIIKDENDVLSKQRLIYRLVETYNEGCNANKLITDKIIQLKYDELNIENKLAAYDGKPLRKDIYLTKIDTLKLKPLSLDTISIKELQTLNKKDKINFLKTYCNDVLLDKLMDIYLKISYKEYAYYSDAQDLYVSLTEATVPDIERRLLNRIQEINFIDRKKEKVKELEMNIKQTANLLQERCAELQRKTKHLENTILVRQTDVSRVFTDITDESSDVNEALKQIEALNQLDKFIFKGVEIDNEYNIKFILEHNGKKVYCNPEYEEDRLFGYSFNDSFNILKGVIYQVESPIRSYNSGKAIGELLKEQMKSGTFASVGTSHSILALAGFERKLLKTEISGGIVFMHYRYTHPNKEYKSFTVIMQDDIIVAIL